MKRCAEGPPEGAPGGGRGVALDDLPDDVLGRVLGTLAAHEALGVPRLWDVGRRWRRLLSEIRWERLVLGWEGPVPQSAQEALSAGRMIGNGDA